MGELGEHQGPGSTEANDSHIQVTQDRLAVLTQRELLAIEPSPTNGVIKHRGCHVERLPDEAYPERDFLAGFDPNSTRRYPCFTRNY